MIVQGLFLLWATDAEGLSIPDLREWPCVAPC